MDVYNNLVWHRFGILRIWIVILPIWMKKLEDWNWMEKGMVLAGFGFEIFGIWRIWIFVLEKLAYWNLMEREMVLAGFGWNSCGNKDGGCDIAASTKQVS